MKKIKHLFIAIPLVGMLLGSSLVYSDTFVHVDVSQACSGSGSSCIYSNAAASTQYVNSSNQIFTDIFILPGEYINPYSEIANVATAIKAKGLRFFTEERWRWQNSIISGTFDCNDYINKSVIHFHLPLKQNFGNTFMGIRFKDEPSYSHIENLRLLKNCWRKTIATRYPQLAQIKIFLNLFPIDANHSAIFDGTQPALLSPNNMGFTCNQDKITTASVYNLHKVNYSDYVKTAAQLVQPDYLGFDFYPIASRFNNCSFPRDIILADNHAIVQKWAAAYSTPSLKIAPVSHLQNYMNTTGIPAGYANFHVLRWLSGIGYSFGYNNYSNFLSHNIGSLSFVGIFDASNNPTALRNDALNSNVIQRILKAQIDPYQYLGYVFPKAGVATGAIIGWMPDNALVAGEYSHPKTGQKLIAVSNRNFGITMNATIAFHQWYTKAEKFNFSTGLWFQVGGGPTNYVQVTETNLPFSFYRLTP